MPVNPARLFSNLRLRLPQRNACPAAAFPAPAVPKLQYFPKAYCDAADSQMHNLRKQAHRSSKRLQMLLQCNSHADRQTAVLNYQLGQRTCKLKFLIIIQTYLSSPTSAAAKSLAAAKEHSTMRLRAAHSSTAKRPLTSVAVVTQAVAPSAAARQRESSLAPPM